MSTNQQVKVKKLPWSPFAAPTLYPPCPRLNYTVDYLDRIKVLKKKKPKKRKMKQSAGTYVKKQKIRFR